MNDLIEALQIMMKHGDVKRPIHCEHDTLYIFPNSTLYIFPNSMNFTDQEISRLEDLGFYTDDENEGFYSFKYGSC